GFTYTIDWGDGSSTQTLAAAPGNGAGLLVDHVFTADGSYTVRVTATDKDGGQGAPATVPVAITAVALQGDTCDPTKTALVVGGTLGNDTIVFSPVGSNGSIQVTINGVSQG